ncbi:TRIM2-like protein [Mya arenaria]|uniref:TRIM2-like protein n=1 Tax=Mya arenaria TaxID=6604 RepID=A0ABY7DRP8_MYAAR|nr:TRIM2-like protein [Mya arenaria]
MTDSVKPTEDPNFKGGVMSPNSKRTFAEMRQTPVVATQKIILDEDMFESSFLRCMVCRERYNMTDRLPRLFPCHHAFCQACILTFYHQETEYRQSMALVPSSNKTYAVSISCPNCKANFITTENGIRELTTDHRIVQLLDFVGSTDRQTVTYCTTHAMQPVNFFCEKCATPICKDCTVLDHKTCSQEKLVVDISAASQKYRPVIEEGKNNLTGEIQTLDERKAECEKSLEGCSQGDDTLSKQIKETFAKIRAAIDKREQELLEMAQSGQGNSYTVVEEKIKKLADKKDEAMKILEDIDRATATGTIQDLFQVYRQIRSYQSEPSLQVDDTEKKDNSESSFQARDETTLLARIGNFGNIQTQPNGVASGSYSGSSYSSGSSYLGSSRWTHIQLKSRFSTYTGDNSN